MKIDDFLKPKQVRFTANDNRSDLTNGKVYDVIGATYGRLKIHNDNGGNAWYDMDFFELVIEPSENPLQKMELTPEFEAVEPVLVDNSVNIQDIGTDILDTNADIKDAPKFEVGDKVYFSTDPDIKTISEVGNDNDVQFVGEFGWASGYSCCHATQENYERLQATFTDIEFERPPLTGNELCRKLLNKGEKYIMAKDDTDTWRIICDYCDDWFTDVVSGKCLKNVTPVNSKGEPLTESVLDE